MNPFVLIGLIVNSALYLVSVFLAGLITGHRAAYIAAILAMGVTYLCYLAQTVPGLPRALGLMLVVLSIASGATAGLFLL